MSFISKTGTKFTPKIKSRRRNPSELKHETVLEDPVKEPVAKEPAEESAVKEPIVEDTQAETPQVEIVPVEKTPRAPIKETRISVNTANSSIKLLASTSRRSSITGASSDLGQKTKRLSSITRLDSKSSLPESPVSTIRKLKKRRLDSGALSVKKHLVRRHETESPNEKPKSVSVAKSLVVVKESASQPEVIASKIIVEAPEVSANDVSDANEDDKYDEELYLLATEDDDRAKEHAEVFTAGSSKIDKIELKDFRVVPDDTDYAVVLHPWKKQMRRISLADYKKFEALFGGQIKINSLKQIPRGISAVNAGLLENFVLDEDAFTIADLCNPKLPIGEVSDNFELAKQAKGKKRKEAARRRALRKEARERRVSYDVLLNEQDLTPAERRKREKEILENMIKEEGQQEEGLTRNTDSIKIQVTSGGQWKVNEESQQIETRANLADGREKVFENQNPFENPIHSGSFRKNNFTDRWTLDETILFYKSLSTWGTDFAVIAELFPYRNRRQVKLKFSIEEKKNLPLIELALANKLPVNFEAYVESINKGKNSTERKKFQSLEEFNRDLDKLRSKHDIDMEQIKKEKEKAKLEDSNQEKLKLAQLDTGRKLTRLEQIKQLREHEEVIGSLDDTNKPVPL